MAKTEHADRILIAITEFSPVDLLWQAALKRIGDTPTELLALYFAEDHWRRAASLPFTREISSRVQGRPWASIGNFDRQAALSIRAASPSIPAFTCFKTQSSKS